LSEGSGCPVCRARFRGSRICSRCGADLEPLMILAVKSWRLREAARAAMEAGQFEQARELAGAAQDTHRTPVGGALGALSRWLDKPRAPIQL
jgi:hypothetical protein